MTNKTIQKLTTDIISLHWWNFGRKKVDFNGKITDYLIEKKFKISLLSHPKDKSIPGYRFKVELSSNAITLDVFYTSFQEAALDAIKLYLTILGDKSLIKFRGRNIRINWN